MGITPDGFDLPDHEGFATLLKSKFVRFGSMVFRARAVNRAFTEDLHAVAEPIALQKQVNHVDMILYVTDPVLQSEWVATLERQWREKLVSEHTDLTFQFELSGKPGSLTLTFAAIDMEIA